MKILMSCRQHPHHLCGGLSIASWNTAKAARDAGHDVTYFTGQRLDDPLLVATVEEGIKVEWLHGMHHDSTGYPVLYKYLEDMKESLCKEFDLFHSQSSALTPLLNEGVPIIFQDHGTQLAAMQDDQNMYAFGLEKRFGMALACAFNTELPYNKMYDDFTLCIEGREIDYLRRFDRVIATSAVSAMDLWTRYYLRNVDLFHHPIYDLPKYEPSPDTSGDVDRVRPTVGFFALELDAPQKYAIYGLKQLLPIKDEIIVRLIGNGPVTVKYAQENGFNVEYTGYLQEGEAIKELQKVDMLFEPSCHHRGCNLTGITALGLGKPIIAYPTGGHLDLVGELGLSADNGPGGCLIDPFDDQAAIDAVRRINQNLRTASQSAWVHFQKTFSPKVAAVRLEEIYADLLSG